MWSALTQTYFQAFVNTFSLLKLTVYIFCYGELSTQPQNSHFVAFDWEKCIEMASVACIYRVPEVCWIQWHWFKVPTISSSWKIKICGESTLNGLKTIKIEWDLCNSVSWVLFYPFTKFQNPMSKPCSQKSR